MLGQTKRFAVQYQPHHVLIMCALSPCDCRGLNPVQ